MAATRTEGTRTVVASNAAIGRHPLHPMIIPFPIALLVAAFAADIAYLVTGDDFWARVGLWAVIGGFVTGVAAAVLGAWDFLTIRRARAHTAGWIHSLGNLAVLVLAGISIWQRGPDPAAAVAPWGVTFSAVWSLLLSHTMHLDVVDVYPHRPVRVQQVSNLQESVPHHCQPDRVL